MLGKLKRALKTVKAEHIGGSSASAEQCTSSSTNAPREAGSSQHQHRCYAGANCYYLMTRAASEGTRQLASDTLDAMQRCGMTMVRTWAFNDGAGWNALQTAPGVYDEQVFVGLDWVVAHAGALGIRLMLTLTNYWHDYGGFQQYIRWSRRLPADADAPDAKNFYTDASCQHMFRAHVAAVIGRINTFTGVAYRDDPTIYAWDIANEPRCDGDTTGNILQGWLDGMTSYIKGLDSKHAVTVGMEGFFGSSTPDLVSANPYTNTHGVDFLRNAAIPGLDFTCLHMYPDQWLPNASESARLAWACKWVDAHLEAARQSGKPLCLQEFGVRPGGHARRQLLKEVLQRSEASAASGGPLTGTLIWMFAHEAYPDYDGYTLYESGQPCAAAARESRQPVAGDAESMDMYRQFCMRLAPVAPS